MIMEREGGPEDPHLRHRHGKALDNEIVVKGLEHIFRSQGMVNPSVFVVVETFQLLLTNVHHLESPCTEQQRKWVEEVGI